MENAEDTRDTPLLSAIASGTGQDGRFPLWFRVSGIGDMHE